MKTTRRTVERKQALEELKRRSHSLNGGIPCGLNGQSVEVQARATRVLNKPVPWTTAVQITGTATGAVSEVMDRIAGAFAGLGIPKPEVKILINLEPADLTKHGTWLDLPIAIILLQAAGVLPDLPNHLQGDYFLMGGLDIHGEVRRVPAALSLALSTLPGQTLIVPAGNEKECTLLLKRQGFHESRVCSVNLLSEVIEFFNGKRKLPFARPPQFDGENAIPRAPDFGTIRGQAMAKRAAIISAAGGHNLLLIGPPGEGKSSLANALPGILPPLSDEEIVELTCISSALGQPVKDGAIVTQRPMVTVHSTATTEALIGGGSGVAKPGEITRAHLGVLFLDEAAEFSASTLDSLRQPLEVGEVHVSRAGGTMTFPARFTLLAAMNPCKCGHHGTANCHCTPNEVRKYEQKLSGPIRDRIDLKVRMDRPTLDERFEPTTTGESSQMREQVRRAHTLQSQRFAGHKIAFNAAIPGGRVEEFCVMSSDGRTTFKAIIGNNDLSSRLKDRLAKVARTVADLDESEHIERRHLEEAARFMVEGLSSDTGRPATPSLDQVNAPSIADGMSHHTGRTATQRTLF